MSRQPMLLISGWAHAAKDLEPAAEHLAATFDVTCMSPADLAMHAPHAAANGTSPYAAGLLEVLRSQPAPVWLLGWSMGGLISLEAALADPAKVAGIIFISSTARFCSDENYPQGIPERDIRALAAAVRKNPDTVLTRFFSEVEAPAESDPESLKARVQDAVAPGLDELTRGLRYLQTIDLRRAARTLHVPAFVIHGTEDRIIPWQAGQWLIENLPGAQGSIMDDVGHALVQQDPELLANTITRFVQAATQSAPERTIARRFSASAATYQEHALVQNRVAEKLMLLVPPSDNVVRILEVGCGTGILTRYLLQNFPNATIDAIDLSPRMIATASAQLAAAPTINWHVADARLFRSRYRYDLIISNCALHWIDPLIEGLHNLASLLKKDGRLAFSLMLNGTLAELHESRLRAAPTKPPLGKLLRFVEVVDDLSLCGLAIGEQTEEIETERHPTATDFLRTIHERGLTGGLVSRAATPLNRAELHRLVELYTAAYSRGGSVRASYVVGYFTATRQKADS